MTTPTRQALSDTLGIPPDLVNRAVHELTKKPEGVLMGRADDPFMLILTPHGRDVGNSMDACGTKREWLS